MSELLSPSPPKVPITFRVGVVGHRPDRLSQASLGQFGSELRHILSTIQTSVQNFANLYQRLYSTEAPMLVAVSSCAEGSDRIFATQALSLGYALHCPMPFSQHEYEADFIGPNALEPDSLSTFRKLLDDARRELDLRIFELDGPTSNREMAYGQAGRIVLSQSDVLVVVWDGRASSGIGGTFDMLQEALTYQIPVIWVDAWQPHGWQLLPVNFELPRPESTVRRQPAQSDHTQLGGLVDRLLAVPGGAPTVESAGHHKKGDSLKAYFAERMPMWNMGKPWKLFCSAVSGTRATSPTGGSELVMKTADREHSATTPGDMGWVNKALDPHFTWADRLACHYADCYRSSFLFSFLGGAGAVFLAILPVWRGWNPQQHLIQLLLAAGIEFGLLLGIIGLIRLGKHCRRHERWLEYRVVAELTRGLHFLSPLGGKRPAAHLSSHLHSYGMPRETWMSWHARAIERATGLPSVRVDEAYVRARLEHLKTMVDGQVEFHRTSATRHHCIEHRLHLWGILLFGSSAAAVAFHFGKLMVGLMVGHENAHGGMDWITVVAIFFPVVGGMLMGIKNQGEFIRLAMRNDAMLEELTRYTQKIDALMNRSVPPTLAEVVQLTRSVAQLMVDEVVDWRVVFLDRPLVPPA